MDARSSCHELSKRRSYSHSSRPLTFSLPGRPLTPRSSMSSSSEAVFWSPSSNLYPMSAYRLFVVPRVSRAFVIS